jgi:hypothetical protein
MALPDKVSYPGPSYDPGTGRFRTGVSEDGRHSTWRLNTPGEGVNHGLIVGGPGTGKSSLLRLLMVEAITSRRFGLWAADPTGRHDLKAMLSGVAGRLAENRAETVELLEAASRVISERAKDGGYTDPSSETPGILLVVEDCGQVFTANRHATRVAEQVVTQGGRSVLVWWSPRAVLTWRTLAGAGSCGRGSPRGIWRRSAWTRGTVSPSFPDAAGLGGWRGRLDGWTAEHRSSSTPVAATPACPGQ